MWFWKSNNQEPLSLLLIPNHRCPQHCLQTTAVLSITSKSSMSSVCLHTPDFFSIASKVLISSVLPPNHQRLQYFLKATILFSIAPKPLSSLLPLNYRCPQYCFQTNKNQRLGYIRSTSSQYKYMYFNFTQMMQYSILQTNRKTSQASHSVKCTTNET